MYTDPGRSTKPARKNSRPFIGTGCLLGLAGCAPVLAQGHHGALLGVAVGLELELLARLVVVLDREQEVHEVDDLLVVHGPALAFPPGRHRRGRPALLHRLPGHVGDLLAGMALPDLVQVGGRVVGRLGVLHAGGDVAFDDPARGVHAVAAGAERLERLLAELDRLLGLLVGCRAHPGRLPDVEERQQEGEEGGQGDARELVALEQPALERLVGRAGPAGRRHAADGPRLLARPGDGDEEGDEDDESRREDEDEDGALAHAFAPPPTQCGPASSCPVVLVPRGGPVTILDVSTRIWSPCTMTGKRSSPRGAGPSLYSPAWLYLEPWQGHSHHCEVAHHGTRQPRCTQRWYSAR